MRIDVVGKNFDVTPAIREYAQSKAGKLGKYFDGLQAITLTISPQGSKQTHKYGVELILDVVSHEDFISHATAKDPYAAIDLVAEKGERHLREHKEKLRKG
jgi:putative sigma-54 modulation protein